MWRYDNPYRTRPDYDDEHEAHKKCEDFLAQIDRVDAEIAITIKDKKYFRTLQRKKADLHNQFATHIHKMILDITQMPQERGARWVGYGLRVNNRFVIPYWRVEGVPPMDKRQEARTWMAERGVDWNGSATSLRGAVSRALTRYEELPEHAFGLYVERTVEIEAPEEIKNRTGTDLIPMRKRHY